MIDEEVKAQYRKGSLTIDSPADVDAAYMMGSRKKYSVAGRPLLNEDELKEYNKQKLEEFEKNEAGYDTVNKPKHYNEHPSGVECITITRHMGFNLGNAFKYIWRADLKNGNEDLKKAIWYLNDELAKRTGTKNPQVRDHNA